MATLYTETITPQEITGFARAAQEDIEARQGTLARWLPNTAVNDVVVRTVVDQDGSGDLAEYRSFDAETPIGSGGKAERKIFELMPLGKKERIGEYDRLRARGGDTAGLILSSVEKATIRRVRGVVNRLELARGQALETGGLSITENGLVQNPSFGRPGGNTVTAPVLWDAASGVKVLENLQTWLEVYSAGNDGADAGAIVTSKRVLSVMLKDAGIRSLVATPGGGTPPVVSVDVLNTTLATYGLPPIYLYDRKVKGTRVTSDNKVFILPEPVDPNTGSNELGGTFFGPTLEAEEPEYGLAASEQPGIAVGVYKTNDPIGLWVHSNAIALPVLVNPVASMVATVLS
ncbi:major capsid protein [Gordonia alkanivorans]|uniref:major capsid protein n=1 Tax=Gordonia alkanivorans TaxID=84096 RepID=UPI0024B69408|nr:major capsid protein [Gordonia alkanivorans]MDJ0010103.1 major capsid protein [Gordonia alkanivorans]MDJ0495707.1 major capsid protein [Gordonia alkanivorans]